MKRLPLLTAALVAAACSDAPLSGPATEMIPSAQNASATASYRYLVAVDFLCGLAPNACPAVSSAANGDRVEISGSGTLSVKPKSVTGGGTFTHKAPDGRVLGSGTWTATQLISFHSYGTSPGFPPGFEGGLAIIRVHLSPGFDATLQVDCAIGKVPPGHTEGIRLAVADVINFNKKVSGLTLFIRQ